MVLLCREVHKQGNRLASPVMAGSGGFGGDLRERGFGERKWCKLTQLAQFDLERGSQFVAAALIDQGLEWLRQSVFGV